PGRGVGRQDRLAERAGATVGEVQDREGAGNGSVLELLDGQASGGWPPRLSAGPEATVAVAFRAPVQAAEQGGKRHGRCLPVCERMKKSSHPARRPSAGAMPGRGGACLAVRPHRPITELGFDPRLSTFMGVAMLVTVMAVRGIVIEDGAEALAVP